MNFGGTLLLVLDELIVSLCPRYWITLVGYTRYVGGVVVVISQGTSSSGKTWFTYCALYFVLDTSKWKVVVRDNWIRTTDICLGETSFSLW